MSKRLAIIGPSAAAMAVAALAQAMKSDRLRPGRAALQSRPSGGERSLMRRRRQIERGQLKVENGLAR